MQTVSGDAVVIGSSGGIGASLMQGLKASGLFRTVVGFSRSTDVPLDLQDEQTIAAAAGWCAGNLNVRWLINAAGVLSASSEGPEKSWRTIKSRDMTAVFEVNTIGPALLMKHFLPLFPKDGPSVFAHLSARVGSIADNRLGGWYSYRASKAALNQLIRTAAVELSRSRPEAMCVAIHPGTVNTALSGGFQKTGLSVQEPDQAAHRILTVLTGLTPAQSGCFFDYKGDQVPW